MAGNVLIDTFYRDFEDRHRGSRQLIQQRLAVYLPFVLPLADVYPELPLLDLGCGRGEWLDLLSARHIVAYGVDTDPAMLVVCQQGGLKVLQADALAHLQALPTHCLLAITGFHIAEHLPFAQLQNLIAQAMRVLAPGGLLILETPNPENLLVGAAWFYLDPTHQRPLPHQLLGFLAEHQGFAPVKLLLLQEEPRLSDGGAASLYDVLGNTSPDYAIVAQSAPLPDAAAQQQLTQAYAIDHGIALNTLANRYDEQRQAELNAQSANAQSARRLAEQASVQAEQAMALAQQQFALAQDLAAQLAAMHASASWRITRPLRWLFRLLRRRQEQR